MNIERTIENECEMCEYMEYEYAFDILEGHTFCSKFYCIHCHACNDKNLCKDFKRKEVMNIE